MHTIVPKWRKDKSQQCYEDLCKSYASALVLADEMGFESIAFPVLASGNNGFNEDLAIDIATESIARYQPKNKLSQAYLVTFGSRITQKMRDRSFDVREAIDQMHVLYQEVHQAYVVKNDKHWDDRWKPKMSPVQELVDGGLKWISNPKNQKKILDIALSVAMVVLPGEGPAETVKKVLNAVVPFVRTKNHK